MDSNRYVVIMAGGVGTRFWPESRVDRPKQFLDILGTGQTLIQMTYNRFEKLVPKENIYVITHEQYKELVHEQLPEIGEQQLLLEPLRRNTAPCIAYASYKIYAKNPDAVITVAPSDHLIVQEDLFVEAWETANAAASDQEKLITIGLKPHAPETGFGYIQFIDGTEDVLKVKTFTEKPKIDLARTFIASGDFLWNSGIFIWGAKAIIDNIEKSLPELRDLFEEVKGQFYTPKEKIVIGQVYSQCTNISIDYGVMEKSENVYVVPADFTWSDLGSWNALHDHAAKDENNNVVQANALLYNTKNTLIKGGKDKLILIQGLDNYLVAESENVVLICRRDNEQSFRDFVADVKDKKGKNYL